MVISDFFLINSACRFLLYKTGWIIRRLIRIHPWSGIGSLNETRIRPFSSTGYQTRLEHYGLRQVLGPGRVLHTSNPYVPPPSFLTSISTSDILAPEVIFYSLKVTLAMYLNACKNNWANPHKCAYFVPSCLCASSSFFFLSSLSHRLSFIAYNVITIDVI